MSDFIHNFRTYYSAITVDSRKKVLYVEERSSRITKGLLLPVETGDIDAMFVLPRVAVTYSK